MKTKHKFLSVLLVVLLCVTLCFSLIACDNNTGDNGEVTDSSKYIPNGNFEVTTSDNFPKTPGSWTGSAGSTSSNNETPVDEKSLKSGVIDTNDSVYDKNKKNWDRLKNPYTGNGKDSNILMIYNRKDNSYKYTSGSFSLDANKYYKLTFDVRTDNMEGYGAYVAITGDTMVEFPSINTKGTWVTYTTYIKTSNIDSNSLSVTVSNGRGGKNDGKLSKGYAFFDNFVVTELENGDEYNDAKEDQLIKKTDMTLGDPNFTNISGTENLYSARMWTGISSVGSDGESAPTGSDYLERGIIDFNEGGVPTVADDVKDALQKREGVKDQRVLMINNIKPTAYSYRTDNRIRLESSQDEWYKLSFWLYTKDLKGDVGAYIKLKSSTDKDEEIYKVENLTSNDKWTQISIYIKPDAMRNKDVYLELGLGKGGKNDTESLVSGQAFFDDITLEKVAESSVPSDGNKYEFPAPSSEDFIGAEGLNTQKYSHAKYDKDGFTENARGVLSNVVPAPEDKPFDSVDNLLKIENKQPTITKYKYNTPFSIEQNKYYRLSIWVKTDLINDKQGINVSLYKVAKNESGKPIADDEAVTTFENINTKVINKNTTNSYNGYTELVFLIEGNYYESTQLYYQIDMGNGTNLTPNSLVQGSVYIADVSLNPISYADYNSESGTYVKKYSVKSQSNSIDNATFDNIDLDNTKKYNKDFDENDFLNGNTKGVFGTPKSWSFTSSDELDKLNAGVFNVNNTQQLTALGFADSEDALKGMPSQIKKNNNNVLAISTKATILRNSWGFTSSSISLSKNKYYEVSVWAYCLSGKASISLKSSNKSVMEKFVINQNDGWTEYKFYVNTGFDDFSAYLELALGDPEGQNTDITGKVLFDLPKITEITEDMYNSLKDETATSKKLTFTTTTFDNVTKSEDDESLDTPVNWSGAHNDSDAPSGLTKSIAGVYNRDHGNRNLFKDKDGKETITEEELINIMNSVPNPDGKEGTQGETNTNILVINNNEASEYEYKTTLADNSLVAESFYEVSLYVLTHNVPDNQHATIRLKLHNDVFEFSLNDKRGINVNTKDKWTKYSFYIMTGEKADIDNVELSVSLGRSGEENFVSGYLFVDDVTIKKIDEKTFNEKAPADKFPTDEQSDNDFVFDKEISSTTHRIEFEESDLNNPPEEEDENKADPLLWLYITSGIIGGLVIIAVIVVLFRKFHVIEKLFPKKNPNGEKGKESYNRDNVNANKSTTSSKSVNEKHKD